MASQEYLPLLEFFPNPIGNRWCRHGNMRVYVTKNSWARVICVSNVYNVRRKQNLFKKEKHRTTGLFSDLMTVIELQAANHGYKYVRVIGIVNEFLPDVLARRGYLPIPPDAPIGMGTDMQLRVIANEQNSASRI